MRRSRQIKDMESLEREIYLLKLELKMMEAYLDKNLDYFKNNYPSLLFNAVFSKKESKSENGSKNSFFHNENLNKVISSISDHIAEHATKGIQDKIDRLFGKK